MKIHFIGIGGIGISALARYYLSKGHKITGSDLTTSEITNALKKLRVKVSIGPHKSKNLPKNIELVVYSPAVIKDNPELKKAQKLQALNPKLQIMSYPEALGELTKKHFTIAISGSHGKSTTTAMIGLLLIKAKFDPTVIVGTKLKEFGDSNCRVGKSEYLVIEADEHFASFLNYRPQIIVLTSLEAEHLDFYKNLANLLKTFKKFIDNLQKDGDLVLNADDKNIKKIIPPRYKNVKWYSLRNKEFGKLKKILQVPGDFNISNALAALMAARTLKIPDKISFKALSEYKGAWRRFEIIKMKHPKPYTLINDYAHHPTKVRVALKAAREKFPEKEIWCVFQPHQYQRTHYLFNDFVKVLKKAPVDKIIITDIYTVAGREKKEVIKRVNSQKLVKAINEPSVTYLTKTKVKDFLTKNLKGGEVVILMGAGDIYDLSLELK